MSTQKPGIYPFLRGIHPTMYRKQLWTMRQYAGFGSAKETNQRFRFLIQQGQSGLSTAFDLPTQLGLDSDAAEAKNEVGRVGVSISTLEDMELLLDRIPLDQISLSMTINAPAGILLAMVLALAKKRKIAWEKLRGTVQNDILKEYLARGTYIFPPKPALKLTTDLIEFCVQNVPQWNPISVSGYHIREAGATAIEELAMTLGHAKTYVTACLERGLKIDSFAHKFSFFFAVHNHFFEEIAKFRAARKIWAQTIKNQFKSHNIQSQKLRFHAQTSGMTLTAQQPENNLARVTFQALAAVLGGAQSLHTNSMDEALSLPSEEAAKLALRTQQIIGFETGITAVVDPLGGSRHLETLTAEMEKKVLATIKKLEIKGGILESLESGFSRRMIETSFLKYQKEIETKATRIVGLNCFEQGNDAPSSRPKPVSFSKYEKAQREKIRSFKKKRNKNKITALLNALEKATISQENLMPHFINCVENKVTLGEICDTLKKVYGEYEK